MIFGVHFADAFFTEPMLPVFLTLKILFAIRMNTSLLTLVAEVKLMVVVAAVAFHADWNMTVGVYLDSPGRIMQNGKNSRRPFGTDWAFNGYG